MLDQIWVWQNHLEVISFLWASMRTLGFGMGCHKRVKNRGATSSVSSFKMISLRIDRMFYGDLDGSSVTLRNSSQPNLPLMVNISCIPTVCPHVPSSL